MSETYAKKLRNLNGFTMVSTQVEPTSLRIGRHEVGQWKPMVSLVRTTHYATFIPILCAGSFRKQFSVLLVWRKPETVNLR